MRDPGLHPGAWVGLLAGLGYRGVAGISASRGEDPPHVVAVRAELVAAGLWRPIAGCEFPAIKPARAAIKACLRRVGGEVAAVREGPRCFLRNGAWEAVGDDGERDG